MIVKKTVVDQIEVTRAGNIQIRFALLLLEDGKELDSKWHRTAIEPGGDVDAQLAAVNEHLVQMGKAPVELADVARVKAIVPVVHTPTVVASFLAARER